MHHLALRAYRSRILGRPGQESRFCQSRMLSSSRQRRPRCSDRGNLFQPSGTFHRSRILASSKLVCGLMACTLFRKDRGQRSRRGLYRSCGSRREGQKTSTAMQSQSLRRMDQMLPGTALQVSICLGDCASLSSTVLQCHPYRRR